MLPSHCPIPKGHRRDSAWEGGKEAEKRKKKRRNREQFQFETAKFQLRLISSLGFFCQVCIQDPSCNSQKNGRRKRKAAASCPHLFYTLKKASFRNWPGTDWK